MFFNRYIDFVNVPAFNFDQDGNTLVHPAKLHGISEMENMVRISQDFHKIKILITFLLIIF